MRNEGILGMNARNGRYIMPYNPRHLYPLVDDKYITKELAEAQGIAVPPLYGVIRMENEVKNLEKTLDNLEDFVIKPAQGSGGDGIIVIKAKRGNKYIDSSGHLIDIHNLKHHVSNILSGLFSLGGHADKALIEYRVKFDPLFKDISYQGVPDIRMVVFRGYPIMAMVRLPTRASKGKANLHQGAVGVGVDLSTGKTTHGVCANEVCDVHPDTGFPIADLRIPKFDDLLNLTARSYELTGLGYLGVDIVLDKDMGPLMLELNARPGLNIQIANQTGLMPRLELIEKIKTVPTDSNERVAYSKEHFH